MAGRGLGRNLRHLVTLFEDLNSLGIGLVTLGAGDRHDDAHGAASACCLTRLLRTSAAVAASCVGVHPRRLIVATAGVGCEGLLGRCIVLML